MLCYDLQVDLLEDASQQAKDRIEPTLLADARKAVSKGAKPDRIRFGRIPRNFKGDINWRSLEVEWREATTSSN